MATDDPPIPMCNYSPDIYGPFLQTLFLGCSVTDFNTNLGWGADSSTATINLVEDTSAHPYMQTFKAQFFDQIKALNQRSALSNTANNLTLNIEDNNQTLIDNNDTVIKDPNLKDNGKRCGNVLWLDEDPGFLGSQYSSFAYNSTIKNSGQTQLPYGPIDLMGVPAILSYGSGFSFAGIISSWRKTISNDGVKYNVELKNFSNLLSNTQLIIGYYGGSIFNLIPNTKDNPANILLGMPGPTGGVFKGPTSTMRNGNLPNVINIYGFLESFGYGNAQENDNGIPAYKIYDSINVLLQEIENPEQKKEYIRNTNPWNPYGGLLCRSPGRKINPDRNNEQYELLDTVGTTILGTNGTRLSLNDLGLLPSIIFDDGYSRILLKLDISEIPRPPQWLRINGPVISLMDFITQLCDGSGFDFFVDYAPYIPPPGQKKPLFSGVIKIKTISRRFQPSKDGVSKFLDSIDSNQIITSNRNYGQEYNDSIVRTMYIGGKQKRLLQCKSHRFTWNQSSFVYDAFANNGKGSFVDIPDVGYLNSARFPSATSYRSRNIVSPNDGIAVFDPQNLPLTESKKENFANQRSDFLRDNIIHPSMMRTDYTHNNIIRQGNYAPAEHYFSTKPPNNVKNTATSIPIYLDLVCPFYGKHYDGSIRKVFYDKFMGQTQILFKIQDLFISGISLSFAEELALGVTHFVVLENEIRAAGTGFEQWLSYCFDNGFFTDIERLVYRAIYRKYGSAATVDIGSIHKDLIDNIKSAGFPNNTSQFGYANASPFADNLYGTLEKIYQIFNNIANEYYGKSYMVSVPSIKSYRNLEQSTTVIGRALDGSPIYAVEGDGKIYSDLSVATDGAWEEAGNYIDDCIIVGSLSSAALLNDNNMIQPILGFNSSTAIDNRLQNFWRAFYNKTLKSDSPYFFNPKIYANPGESNTPYSIIYSDIPYNDYTNIYPVVSNLSLAKTYIKCSISEQIEFIEQPESYSMIAGKSYNPKVIITLPSPVYINTLTPASNNLLTVMLHDSFARAVEATPVANRTVQSPSLPTEVTTINAVKIAAEYLYNLGNFGQSFLTGFYKTETDIGGLKPKMSANRFAGLVQVLDIIKAISNAYEVSHINSLGEGLFPIFPFNNPGASADGYNNAQILPKAALPCFAGVPLQLNQSVYGPWINYPILKAGDIFRDIKPNIVSYTRKVENLIAGVKVVVDDNLVPWNFGSMTALDNQMILQISSDVNYQQELENGSIEIPIFPNLSLGGFLSNGPLITQLGVNIGNGGVSTSISFRTYTRKLGLFNKENADRLKSISLESIKRNKAIINKYNELRDRMRTGSVGSEGSVTDMANANLPKMLRWSPSEILVGSTSVKVPKDSTISDLHEDLNYSPSYFFKPTYKGDINAASGSVFKEVSTVTVQDFREAPKELLKNFNQKSMMSLDGIISPVSLYPTPHNSTFHIAKYDQKICPVCRGKKVYEYNSTSKKILNKSPGAGSSAIDGTTSTKMIFCDFCEDKTSSISSSSLTEQDPPFILTNSSDSAALTGQFLSAVSLVTYQNLNPIILPSGEFSASGNRQKTDQSAFSINTVSFGAMPPNRNGEGMRINSSNNIQNAYSTIDINYSQYMKNIDPKEKADISNNHRFFGFRGPIILHSWGYDTEGFPVPNQADEPVMNGTEYKRKDDGSILLSGEDPNDPTVFVKENKFYNGWAQFPGTWPVGPIDFRWDRERRVWTVGERLQFAFVVLEQDLTDAQPVRGALWNNKFVNNKPLPNGYRKLVFVKDNKGITAPRGAKIYCQYSKKNGFYEPIYAGAYTASGVVNSSNTALIYNSYSMSTQTTSDKQKADNSYTASYSNPLGFAPAINSIGIFTYINGKWILIAQNGC